MKYGLFFLLLTMISFGFQTAMGDDGVQRLDVAGGEYSRQSSGTANWVRFWLSWGPLLLATYLISRKIAGQDPSPYRQTHFYLGLAILSFYVVEVFLGLGVLL